ncbi:MAG: DUF1566 domain-containing protein, partial [Gammaproteobacteria bacterium]|nr:DUF1566 domain-containing protein [Gammaproteobacteria bacterium]
MFRKSFIAFVLLMVSSGNQAALFDRGGGMIYDDALDITWLQNANLGGDMNWDDSVAWADGLSHGGFEDWRLVSMDVNGDESIVDCNGASELACRDNELGYMFFYNLAGSPGDDLVGDQAMFTNIASIHWSDTEYAPNSALAWGFRFVIGGVQGGFNRNDDFGAWAVRD